MLKELGYSLFFLGKKLGDLLVQIVVIYDMLHLFILI